MQPVCIFDTEGFNACSIIALDGAEKDQIQLLPALYASKEPLQLQHPPLQLQPPPKSDIKVDSPKRVKFDPESNRIFDKHANGKVSLWYKYWHEFSLEENSMLLGS